MANTPILITTCLVLGLGAAWLLKKNSPPEPPAQKVETAAATPETPRKEIVTEAVKKAPKVPEPEVNLDDWEVSEEGKKSLLAHFERTASEEGKAADIRLELLTETLNLTAEQSAALQEYFDKTIENIKKGIGPDNYQGEDLEGLLTDLLDDNQVQEYQELKKRERHHEVEKRALKQLADLDALNLTDEQKEAAYDVLYTSAEKVVDDPVRDQVKISYGFGKPSQRVDRQDFLLGRVTENQRPARRRLIEEKIEQLRPIVTEQQLELYRSQLEGR